MTSEFNAIDYAQQLAAVGVPQEQADVHAKALSRGLSTCAATKADLAALEEKLASRINLLEARIDLFEAKITARLDAFEAKLSFQLIEMRGELAVIRAERKYDRRVLHLVLALQIALIAKAFFF
jgi:LPS O-antigen subunit length determinant protein (WzzB/FepE family)